MKENVKRKAILIVVATFLTQFFVVTVAANLVPIFQPTIVDYYGLSDVAHQFSLIYTIGVIIPAFAAPIIPTLYEKLGFKVSYIIGVILSAGGFLSMAFAPMGENQFATLLFFWVAAAIFNIGNAIIGSLGIPSLLNQWFAPEEKGRYLGIAFMGASAGAVAANILLNFVKPSVGNITHLIILFGGIALIIGILIALFLIRKPTAKEYTIIHSDDAAEIKEEEKTEVTGMTLQQAVKSPIFIAFVIGLVCLGLYVSAMSTQYATYIKNSVPDGDNIYLKVSLLFSLCAIAGNLLGGFLFDKLKPFKTILLGGALAILAVLSLIIGAHVKFLVLGFGLFYGLSVFTYIVLPGYMTGHLFGDKAYSKILGICQMVFALGFAVGSMSFGILVRSFGYGPSWILVLVAIILCYLCFLTATVLRNKLNKAN